MAVDSLEHERAAIRQLVQQLGAARGARAASDEEVARLRVFFGRRVLRAEPNAYILGKYRAHVEGDEQWSLDTTPEEYLESLRQTVLDPRSSIYLTNGGDYPDWTLYFVGAVRRPWRGPNGSSRVVVLFNGERHLFVTGFQPERGVDYVEEKGGFWVWGR